MTDFRLPKHSSRFLAWLLNDSGETGLGDFYQYYQEVADEVGPQRAAWQFRLQVLAMTPGRLAEKLRQELIMLANYITLAVRHFRKNRLASTINVFGLSVAIACCVTAYLFLSGYTNMNAEHENGDRTYLVEQQIIRNGTVERFGSSPMPLGPALATELAAVEGAVRISGRGGLVYAGERPFESWILFAEAAFLDVFDFPMASGTPSALLDPEKVILSDREATRLFGSGEVLGEELTIVLSNGRSLSVTVGGVAEPFATSAGIRFTTLMNLDRIADESYADWTVDAGATFLILQPGASRSSVDGALERYVAVHNSADPENEVVSFALDNIQQPNPGAWRVQNRIIDAPNPIFIAMLLAIPVFMLALSCFNYINIAMGAASRRLREIGVRKVLGGSRSQLVYQFLGENLLLCFLSVLLGVGVAFVFLIPLFNSILVNQITFSLGDVSGLIGFLLVLLLGVGLLSGFYPALYVSSFRPIQVLRQKVALGRRSWLTGALLTAQFTLAFLTVILSVYLTMNGRYMIEQEWGYDPSGVISIRVGSASETAFVGDALRRQAGVGTVTNSIHQVGVAAGRQDVTVEGQEFDVWRFAVGAEYLRAMGLETTTGRPFSEEFAADHLQSVIVNEAFLRRVGWEDPLARSIRVDGASLSVVGVVQDFLVTPIVSDTPVLFTRSDASSAQFVTARLEGGEPRQVIADLRSSWKSQFPGRPFDATIQSEVFDGNYRSYSSVVQAFSYIAALALAIACLGLFGLASQNIAARLKDVSIRKVLGASIAHLIVKVNLRFIWMLVIAGGVATVLTVIAFTALNTLPPMDVRFLPLGPGLFVIAYVLVAATASLAVGSQARLLIRSDPAVVLRND